MRRLVKIDVSVRPTPAKSVNGVIIRRPVDQTPSHKTFRDSHGFFKNDIMLLREVSNSGDKALFEQLASRLQQVETSGKSMTIQEAFDRWKPAVIQTVSEEQAWVKYVHDFMPDVAARLYPEKVDVNEDSGKSVTGDSDNVSE